MPEPGLDRREWLCTSGHGAYASGTVGGPAERRYHGLLIAAVDPPAHRRMVLTAVDATIYWNGERIALATHRYEDGTLHPDGCARLVDFTSVPCPTWTWRLPDGATITRTLRFTPRRNEIHLECRVSEGSGFLEIAPQIADRDHHALRRRDEAFPTRSERDGPDWVVALDPLSGILRLRCPGAHWQPADWWNERIHLAEEARRGFDAVEDWWCPATAQVPIAAGAPVRCIASLETIPSPLHAESDARAMPETPRNRLARAARHFVVETPRRTSILAGYPWFADWGRDTCIALPGILLSTGHVETARRILLDFASTLRNGRIPNRFPDIGEDPAYNNIDATLWFVRACRLALEAQPDTTFAQSLEAPIRRIIAHHVEGTVGDEIGMDTDGLLRGGNAGTNLTWMDAKVRGVPVTPRDGKPVEIQALWIDSLAFAGRLLGEPRWTGLAEQAIATFVRRFVRPDGLGLYDRLRADDTPDASIRPNQVIACAVLGQRLAPEVLLGVLESCERELLAPFGLRTLARSDAEYRGTYGGPPEERDAAYHQGTVWPWLIGSYVDLARLVRGDQFDVDRFLAPLVATLDTAGIDGISEIHGAEPPHAPDGCPWQAWSVAEVLRALGPSPIR